MAKQQFARTASPTLAEKAAGWNTARTAKALLIVVLGMKLQFQEVHRENILK
jgi:hypothetical protein